MGTKSGTDSDYSFPGLTEGVNTSYTGAHVRLFWACEEFRLANRYIGRGQKEGFHMREVRARDSPMWAGEVIWYAYHHPDDWLYRFRC